MTPTASTLKHLVIVSNVNMGFTRGLAWNDDVHYNADKGGTPSQRQHTFAWDNVAFDGPFVYRDFSYDALDNNTPDVNGSVDLGKFAAAGSFDKLERAGDARVAQPQRRASSSISIMRPRRRTSRSR